MYEIKDRKCIFSLWLNSGILEIFHIAADTEYWEMR